MVADVGVVVAYKHQLATFTHVHRSEDRVNMREGAESPESKYGRSLLPPAHGGPRVGGAAKVVPPVPIESPEAGTVLHLLAIGLARPPVGEDSHIPGLLMPPNSLFHLVTVRQPVVMVAVTSAGSVDVKEPGPVLGSLYSLYTFVLN